MRPAAISLAIVVGILTAGGVAGAQSHHHHGRNARHGRHHHSSSHRSSHPTDEELASEGLPAVASTAIPESPTPTPVLAVAQPVEAPGPTAAAPATEPAAAAAAPVAPTVVAVAPVAAPVAASPTPSVPLRSRLVREGSFDGGAVSTRGIWKFLFAVLGLGAGVVLWRRRMLGGVGDPASEVVVKSRTSIGGRCDLLVVEVDGQRMLLGATQNSVQYLTTLEAQETPSASPTTSAGFESMFAAARTARESGTPTRAKGRPAPERTRDADDGRSLTDSQPVRRSYPPRTVTLTGNEQQVRGLLAIGAQR